MTVMNNEDPADPSTHHTGCPTPGGCSEHGCHGACLPEDEMDKECQAPPLGWRCTRVKGHEGPCAAVECPEDIEFVQRGMDRLREQPNTGIQRRSPLE